MFRAFGECFCVCERLSRNSFIFKCLCVTSSGSTCQLLVHTFILIYVILRKCGVVCCLMILFVYSGHCSADEWSCYVRTGKYIYTPSLTLHFKSSHTHSLYPLILCELSVYPPGPCGSRGAGGRDHSTRRRHGNHSSIRRDLYPPLLLPLYTYSGFSQEATEWLTGTQTCQLHNKPLNTG